MTGLPAARSWVTARAMTSDANAEPPGLLTRRMTARIDPSRLALVQRGDQRVGPRHRAEIERQLLAGPVDDGAVDQHDGDPFAGPGPGRQRRRVGVPDRDLRPLVDAAEQRLQLALVGDGVDQAGELRLARREQAAGRPGAGPRRRPCGGRCGCDRRRSPPPAAPNTSSRIRFLLARTSGDCSFMTNGSIAPLNSPIRTRSTWTPIRSIAPL